MRSIYCQPSLSGRFFAFSKAVVLFLALVGPSPGANAQISYLCPFNLTTTGSTPSGPVCAGQNVSLCLQGNNIPAGSTIEWYAGPNATFDPYSGQGVLLGSVSVASSSPEVYSQNFDGLSNSGTTTWTNNTTLAAWYSNRTSLIAGTGSGTLGGLYSFGTAGSTERALGSLASGGTGTIYFGLELPNITGCTITSATVSYTGEQWRNGGNTTQHALTVSYQVDPDGNTVTDIASASGWTSAPALTFTGPIATATAGAINPPATAAVNGTINGLSVPANGSLWLRWEDLNDTGNDHGLGVDDLTITLACDAGNGQIACFTYTIPTSSCGNSNDDFIRAIITPFNPANCSPANATSPALQYTATCLTATLSGSGAFCTQGALTMTVAITGGTGPYTVVYTDNNGNNFTVNNYNSGDPINQNVTATTTFNLVSVADAGGCASATLSGSAVATVSPDGLTLGTTISDPTCANNDGAINNTVGGGLTPYTFNWSTPDGAGIVPGQEDQFTLSAGSYFYTVTDAGGCTESGAVTLTLPPGCNVVCPIVSASATNATCGQNNGSITVTATGGTAPYFYNIGGGAQSSNVFNNLAPGTYTVTVTDSGTCNGDYSTTATATVNAIADTQAPQFNPPLPIDVTISCSDPLPTVPTVTASDNCDPNPAVSFSEQSTAGDCPQESTIARTWTATDNAGNATTYTQVITRVDNSAPTLDGVPPNVTVSCDAIPPAPTVTATDNCDPSPLLFASSSITMGNCPNSFIINRSWSAEDACGNATSAFQQVTVIDNTPPTLVGVPANVTVQCDAVPTTPPTVTATDNCDTNVPVGYTQTTTAGNCPGNYTITRTWTAQDDCGNGTSAVQTITVVDNKAPVFTPPLPADFTVGCTDFVPAPPTLSGIDNCDPGSAPPVIFINEIHYDNVGGDVGEFIEVAGTAGLDLSQYQLILYNGNGGVSYNTLTLSGTIDDEGGGFGAVSFAYPVNGIQNGSPDGMALVKLPNTVVQYLSYEGSFLANDGPAAGLTSSDIGVFEAGTDPSGFSLQLTGSGQVYNNFTWTGPIAQTPGSLNAGQTISTQPGAILASFMESQMMGACEGSMVIKRMWTLTDNCGNTATYMQTINVLDNVPPSFAPPLPPNITISCSDPVPAPAVLTAIDNCDPVSPDEIVWINEIHYDNVGTDVNEFIEVAGTAGINLSAYTLYLYNGSGGGTYNTLPLTGVIDNESNGLGAVAFSYPINGIQNGSPDGVALVKGGMVLQFLSYEGTFTAVGGPANGQLSTDIGVFEDGNNAVGTSLRLTGTGNQYSNFTWNAPAAATPGTLNQGQNVTPIPNGLVVTFSETTVPGACPPERTITRTWSVSDDCGNSTSHVQVITVDDFTGPALACNNITVNLNINGTVSVPTASLIQSLSDNCSATGSITVTPAGPNVFTCAQEGTTVPVTISATDICGNTSTCVAQVTVNPFDRCTPEISIVDPCLCLNNATTLTNGQFRDRIYIESLTGKTWTITGVTGLYSALSPAPPAAPIAITPGTQFVESPAGSGDYFLNGIHIDAQGYSITVRSEIGEILTIGNSCSYPNPVITSDLSGPFCLYSDPVNLTGDPGDANIVSASFTINGAPATVFNPANGVGEYVIVYTVNGGTPKAFGPNDPGCTQSVQVIVQVVATPTVLTCNDLVQVSLDEDCISEVTPDMILEGTYGCFDDYSVTITGLNGLPNYGNTVTVANIGQTLKATVTHLVSGNSCWGTILVQDKLAPLVECKDIFLSCGITEYTPAYLDNTLNIDDAYPAVTENCGTYTQSYADTWVDLACTGSINGISDLSAYVRRVWTVTDGSGNSATCVQFIYFERRHVYDVLYPTDITVDCSNPNVDPSATGVPYIEEFGIKFDLYPNNSFCELNTAYTDQILPVCDGTYKIIRTWIVFDWCLPTSPYPPTINPQNFLQIITVMDQTAPTVACPANLTVSTDPTDCTRDFDLPDVLISDNCSRIASISAKWVLGGITQELDGTLTDFPNNNYWNPDTLGVLGFANNLPLGKTKITYIVTDACGNSKECTFEVTVRDDVPPVAACDQLTQVSVGPNGQALIDAETFDDGSYDNCSPVNFKARRMNSNSCQSNGQFYDQVRFCCNDVGQTITIVLRVYDVPVPAGNVSTTFEELRANDCMVQVQVDDKLSPICLAPANVTVTCENFDPSLWAYGQGNAVDNCCVDTITTTINLTQFDTLCNKGTITRTFRAFDCHSNSSFCTQRIVVTYNQNYYVRFPNDVIVTFCDSSGVYGQPTFFGEDCEQLGVSFEDQLITVVPDACYLIERTWNVINWCTYNPNLPLTFVPNPNPNPNSSSPQNLPGPTVSPVGTPAPWAPTVVKINPTDPTTTNYSIYWTANTNGYTYKQTIKIIDTQDPIVVDGCPTGPVEFCDLTPNEATLWNASYWWDNAAGSHNLCEGPTDLRIQATDDCSGSNITINYLLFLDLDGDGSMETVVNSKQPQNPNEVLYGNALNPNFTGGTPREFDQRPVPFGQKYRFALESSVQGNNRTARVRWNTLQSPLSYFVPELPYGTHKIKWIIEDGCGNETVCEYTFIVKDCKAPTVVCLNGLSVNIMPTGMVTLWASDFLQYGEDNCTPGSLLQYSLRKGGTGTGFPVDGAGNPINSLTFTCDELGNQAVELWARDLAGNADFCGTYVLVQDNQGYCPFNKFAVAGVIATEESEGVEEVLVDLNGQNPVMAPIHQTDMTDNTGAFQFPSVPVSTSYTVTPVKDDNPLNGVSTYDLVLISRHILGLEPFNSPFKMIAADANKSGSITTFDIVEIRKLILGINQEFPNNTSWRFVDKDYVFPNPANPFSPQFPETISKADVQVDQLADDFVGVKIGDVNNNVIPNGLTGGTDDRSAGTLLFDVSPSPDPSPTGRGDGDRVVKAGEVFDVTFKAAERVQGYQFTLNTPGMEVVDLVPGADMKADNFAVFADAVTTSFDGAAPGEFTVKFRAKVDGQLSNLLGISSRITKAEAYSLAGEKLEVAFRFNGTTIAGVGFELYQNQPNPFVNKTMIGFHLPEATQATLTIFDETGRMLHRQTGDFGKGYNAIPLERALLHTTGVLYYKLETATDSATKKMIQTK